jgi:hypothetical protein
MTHFMICTTDEGFCIPDEDMYPRERLVCILWEYMHRVVFKMIGQNGICRIIVRTRLSKICLGMSAFRTRKTVRPALVFQIFETSFFGLKPLLKLKKPIPVYAFMLTPPPVVECRFLYGCKHIYSILAYQVPCSKSISVKYIWPSLLFSLEAFFITGNPHPFPS